MRLSPFFRSQLLLFLNAVALATVALSTGIHAHHSGANFDRSSEVELVGTITDYNYKNPHIYIELDVTDESGNSQSWLVEGHSVTGARRLGWTRDSFVAGEEVTIVANPDRDVAKRFAIMITATKSDGSLLYAFRKPATEVVVEKSVAPAKDFSGTWGLDLSMFDFLGANGQPPAELPLTEKGALQRGRFTVDDNPALGCQTVGVPRMVVWPYGYNFSREGDLLFIEKEHENITREVHLDRALDDVLNEQEELTHIGVSVGRFESPRHLIVETAGFSYTPWGIRSGLDSSTQKRVTEHYRLADDGLSMDVVYSAFDPEFLNEPLTLEGRYTKTEDREFEQIPCDPETAARHVED